MDALARIEKYIKEREQMNGLDPEVIHGLHSGHETREAVLTLSDLREVVLYANAYLNSAD